MLKKVFVHKSKEQGAWGMELNPVSSIENRLLLTKGAPDGGVPRVGGEERTTGFLSPKAFDKCAQHAAAGEITNSACRLKNDFY